MKQLTRIPAAWAFFFYFVAYIAFDAAARVFEVAPDVSLWYPPVGLALVLAAVFGWRCAPAVLVADLGSAFVSGGASLSWGHGGVILLTTAVYVGAGALIRRRFGPLPSPVRPLETAALIALILGATIVAALAGSAVNLVSGSLAPHRFAHIVFDWWIGDFTGVLTVVPVGFVLVVPRLLASQPPPQRTWSRRDLGEVALQVATLLLCSSLVQGFAIAREFNAHYLCFAPLVWICLRHGLPGATLATAALTMSSLAAIKFFGGTEHAVFDLLLFEIAVAAVGLGLGLVVTRRQAVERERARLLAILEVTPDYIGTADLEGRVLYYNTAFLKLRGHSTLAEVLGHSIVESHTPASAQTVLHEALPAARTRGLWHGETVFLDQSGREVPVLQLIFTHYDDEGRPLMFSIVARDITDRKEAERVRLESERNLLQAQKLESLGVLAGGIAHDFNNLLTTMLGNATLARLDTPAQSPAEKSIHQIELAALRAAELCRQMLAYSGRGKLAATPVDLNALVRDTTHLLKVSISKKSHLVFELAPTLPSVHGDATQLSQIVMNLVMNASDAIGENSGHITVRTGAMHADRAYLAGAYLAPSLEPGDYVFFEVIDDGCGMTPEVQARIFEPFYTTKFTGHGLGLSAVLGITRSHQGAIKVDSTPGRGTTFRLLLPAVTASAPKPVPAATTTGWRGSGRVLVADDEDAVLEISARILARSGFTVQTAADGRQAVEAVRREPGAFRLVLLDMMMPVLDGAEAFNEIRQLDPAVPVILMSGYTERQLTQRLGAHPAAGFVQKPFATTTLLDTVRTALDLAAAVRST